MEIDRIKTLDIALTTRCNLKCPFCYRTIYENKIMDLHPSILDKLDILPKLDKIIICGSQGEPTLSPYFMDFLHQFIWQTYDNDTKIIINTNGNINDSNFWNNLGEISNEYNVHVVFAIDGIETYSKYRKGGNIEIVLNNLEHFVNAGGKAIWQYVVFEHNQIEIPKAKYLAFWLNAEFRLVKSHTYKDEFKKSNIECSGYPKYKCKDGISIDVTGEVSPCCHSRPFKLKLLDDDKVDMKMLLHYGRDKDRINLYKSTLEKCLTSNFFRYIMDTDNSLCFRNCIPVCPLTTNQVKG